MVKWIKASGILRYDPKRPEDFRKTHKARTLVIELPRDDLDLYYQWFLTKKFGSWMNLGRPMFGKHVTLVGGKERVQNMQFWKKYEGRPIEFEYSPELRKAWQFWTLPVRPSLEMTLIRTELGMSPDYHYHLTIGRFQHDWQQNFFKGVA